jgi:hypothetical protein
VLRRILTLACLSVLCACAAPRAKVAVVPPAPIEVAPPPKPADGLWAILDPGCAKPNVANIHAWPSCASPFWISGDQALVILSGQFGGQWGLHDVSYAAKLNLTPGDPMIARVGTEKDGYVFLALTDLTRDDQGRLIGAVGAAVACPGMPQGELVLRPNLNGCDKGDPDGVRRAAEAALKDRASLTQVSWIAAGAPGGP